MVEVDSAAFVFRLNIAAFPGRCQRSLKVYHLRSIQNNRRLRMNTPVPRKIPIRAILDGSGMAT